MSEELPEVCACERNDWEMRQGEGGSLVVCRSCGYIAAVLNDVPGAPSLHQVTLTLCDLCLTGAGGQCHVPGCSLWLHAAPDIPVYMDVEAER